MFSIESIHFPNIQRFIGYYRQRQQAADLPAKVGKRIGCAHKRGCSFEIGWSRIFGRILGHELSVNFYATFPRKTTYFALHTERSRDLSGQIHSNATNESALGKLTATNLAQNTAFKGAYFI